MYIVTRTLPDGTVKTSEAKNSRGAGQVVAFTLHYNTRLSRKEATQYAMTAERTGTVSAEGYTFTIEKMRKGAR